MLPNLIETAAKKTPIRFKTVLQRWLRPFPWAVRLASKTFYTVDRRFYSLSPKIAHALRQAFAFHFSRVSVESRDYYEFGLFRGASFLAAQKACDFFEKKGVHFYGFDSFTGLPNPEGIDRAERQFFEGQFAWPRRKVEHALSARSFDWSRGDLIEGYYKSSLTHALRNRYPFRDVAVVLFDCDLYESTRDALHWLAPYLAEHSVLLFDDWRACGPSPNVGQPRAFEEFLRGQSRFRAEKLWPFPHHGQAFYLLVKPSVV